MKLSLVTAIIKAGGAARAMINMANHWASAGHEITLFSFEDGTEEPLFPLHENITVVYLDINKYSPNMFASVANNWERMRKIRRSIFSAQPEAIISFIDTANIRVILSLLGSGIPVIISERIHPQWEKIGFFWNTMRKLVYPLADSLVVQTEEIKEFCLQWNVRDTRVIPNPAVHLPDRGEAPKLSKPALLAVGRLDEQKCNHLLLDAFNVVCEKHADWKLYIAGTGSLSAEVAAYIKELGLEDRVELLGFVQDIGGLLSQADAYVMSSAYEGFPNSLCEALISGLPCLSTDCPSGPADMIVDDENGLLVPVNSLQQLADGLNRIMSDESLRERLGKKACFLANDFAPERIMGLWDACIKGAVESK